MPAGQKGDKKSNQKHESEQGIEFTFKNILSSNTISSPVEEEGAFKKQWKKIEEKIMNPLFVKTDNEEKRSAGSVNSSLTDVTQKEKEDK